MPLGRFPPAILFTAALGLLGVIGPRAAFAEPSHPFGGRSRPVREAALAPALGDAEGAYERYVLEAYLDDGREVYFRLRFHNMGPGDGKAQMKSRVQGAGMREHEHTQKRARGDYRAGGSPLRIVVGDHVLSGDLGALRIRGGGPGYAFDLSFQPEVPPWRPGGGRAVVPGGSYTFTLLAPKARVRGTVTVDGVQTKVSGHGYAFHDVSTVSPHELAKRWVRFRALHGDTVIWLWEIVSPTPAGSVPMPFLLVARKGRILLGTTKIHIRYGRFSTDRLSPNRYQVPSTLLVHAGERGVEVTLAVEGRGPYRRTDELARLSSLERWIVGKLTRPVRYTWQPRYQVRIKGIKGTKGTKGIEGAADPVTYRGQDARLEITQFNP